MFPENIMGAVFYVLCSWLCAGIFLGRGFYRKSEKNISLNALQKIHLYIKA